jgi:hypothetical protein
MKKLMRDDTEHGKEYYLASEVDALLAKQEQGEPVAWMDADGNVSDNNDHKCFPIPLYTK